MTARKSTKKSAKRSAKKAAKSSGTRAGASKTAGKAAGKKAAKKVAGASAKASTRKAPKKKAAPKAAASTEAAAAPASSSASSKPAKSKRSGVDVATVNMGHIFALRPRVTTSFPPQALRDAKVALADEGYETIEDAARAIAEKALEITHEGASPKKRRRHSRF